MRASGIFSYLSICSVLIGLLHVYASGADLQLPRCSEVMFAAGMATQDLNAYRAAFASNAPAASEALREQAAVSDNYMRLLVEERGGISSCDVATRIMVEWVSAATALAKAQGKEGGTIGNLRAAVFSIAILVQDKAIAEPFKSDTVAMSNAVVQMFKTANLDIDRIMHDQMGYGPLIEQIAKP